MFEILLYQSADGDLPFRTWQESLDPSARAKVQAAIERMAAGSLGDAKSVGAGVLERRIDWGPGYRLYFGREGSVLIILLAGGTKHRQQQDVVAAQARWADYKRRRG